MLSLPTFIMTVIDPFAQAFWGTSTWYRAQEMVVGAFPALFGLFSLASILADTFIIRHGLTLRSAAWYHKAVPTFADALALVRLRLWRDLSFQMSASDPDVINLPRALVERFNDLPAYAA